MKRLQQTNLWRWKADEWLPETMRRGKWGMITNGPFLRWWNVLELDGEDIFPKLWTDENNTKFYTLRKWVYSYVNYISIKIYKVEKVWKHVTIQKMTSFQAIAIQCQAFKKEKEKLLWKQSPISLWLMSADYFWNSSISPSAMMKKATGWCKSCTFYESLCRNSRSARAASPKAQCLVLDSLHGPGNVWFRQISSRRVQVPWARNQTCSRTSVS